jgi:hypothetical protein
MARHIYTVPGYAVRPTLYGPSYFERYENIDSTDILGYSTATGTTFRCKATGLLNGFHFPITNPTMLADKRLICNFAAVTMYLGENKAFLNAIEVVDRVHTVLAKDLRSARITGDYRDEWTLGENAFSFPNHSVDGAMGVTVYVDFEQTSNVIFTGAGLIFHD